MRDIKIYIDADSCARKAKEHAEEIAIKYELKLFFVANRNIPFKKGSPLFTMIVSESSSGAADDCIVDKSDDTCIVVTRDIPLAERLVKKNVKVMNDRGKEFTKDNIQECISQRNLSLQMRQLGISTGGKWNSYSDRDSKNFSATLEKIISLLIH